MVKILKTYCHQLELGRFEIDVVKEKQGTWVYHVLSGKELQLSDSPKNMVRGPDGLNNFI